MRLASLSTTHSAKRLGRALITTLSALAITLGLQACGGGGGGGSGSTGPTISLLAGSVGGTGALDGTGADASFNFGTFGSIPGLALDSANNLYVADTLNHVIRKISASGVVTVFAGTVGTSGNANGSGISASFNRPLGLTVDTNDNVYVADSRNFLIRKITPSGFVTTHAGSGVRGSANGLGTSASFGGQALGFATSQGFGLASDGAGNVYVADSYYHTIRKISPLGLVTTVAGTAGSFGATDGAALTTALFSGPSAVAVDTAGNVFICDTGNSVIRKLDTLGNVTTFAGTTGTAGALDGSGVGNAQFNRPANMAFDSTGNLYVTDVVSHTIRRITTGGTVSTLAGSAGLTGSLDGSGTSALFSVPSGIAVSSLGNIFVVDRSNHTIRKVTTTGAVTTFAGTANVVGSTNGTGASASFNGPLHLSADSAGNIFAADSSNSIIRKITSNGAVTTFAGIAGTNGSLDGASATATFNTPYGTAVDLAGNVYVADQGNAVVRKIDTAGMVTTLSSAGMTNVSAVAVDTAGNVYVADQGGQAVHKITTAGAVSVFASGIDSPVGITVDAAGNVYVTNSNNHTISKITALGVVSTLAGTGSSGSTDNTVGTMASFNNPYGITLDSIGNLYVADKNNHTIRKITPAGAVTTVVGVVGKQGFANGGVLPGYLRSPNGVVVSNNKLYISTSNGIVVTSSLP